jgi:hypothetical protein
MRAVGERDPTIHGGRHFELAYLANVLIAGCSIQSRPFADKEAAEAAVATCNPDSSGCLPRPTTSSRTI